MRLKDWARSRNGARAVGVTATVAFFVLVEALIRAGLVNQFIVPLHSQIIASIPRIIAEEHVLDRFLQTMQEVRWASVMIAVVGI